MVFDKANMAADFIRIVEEGMEKSKTDFKVNISTKTTKANKPKPAPVAEEHPIDDEPPFDVDEDIDEVDVVEENTVDFDAIRTEIRNKNKAGTAEQKKAVKALLASTGKKLDEVDDVEILTQMLEVFE
jgi:hypothetical protein